MPAALPHPPQSAADWRMGPRRASPGAHHTPGKRAAAPSHGAGRAASPNTAGGSRYRRRSPHRLPARRRVAPVPPVRAGYWRRPRHPLRDDWHAGDDDLWQRAGQPPGALPRTLLVATQRPVSTVDYRLAKRPPRREADPPLRTIRVAVETVYGGGCGCASHAEVVTRASPPVVAGAAVVARVARTGTGGAFRTGLGISGNETAVVDALFPITARTVDRAPAAVGQRPAELEFAGTGLRRAAAGLIADLPRRTRRDAVAGRIASQALAGGAVAAYQRALAAVGNSAAASFARPRGTTAADPEADLIRSAGVIADATVIRVIETGALIATADLAGWAAHSGRQAAGSRIAAFLAAAAVSGGAAPLIAAGLSGPATLPAAAVSDPGSKTSPSSSARSGSSHCCPHLKSSVRCRSRCSRHRPPRRHRRRCRSAPGRTGGRRMPHCSSSARSDTRRHRCRSAPGRSGGRCRCRHNRFARHCRRRHRFRNGPGQSGGRHRCRRNTFDRCRSRRNRGCRRSRPAGYHIAQAGTSTACSRFAGRRPGQGHRAYRSPHSEQDQSRCLRTCRCSNFLRRDSPHRPRRSCRRMPRSCPADNSRCHRSSRCRWSRRRPACRKRSFLAGRPARWYRPSCSPRSAPNRSSGRHRRHCSSSGRRDSRRRPLPPRHRRRHSCPAGSSRWRRSSRRNCRHRTSAGVRHRSRSGRPGPSSSQVWQTWSVPQTRQRAPQSASAQQPPA